MSNLENTVREIVEDFIKNGVLFTALDVSNTVKRSLPHTKHREVRDVVRSLFTTDIEGQGWARTPITVTLEDGSTAEALLYHPLADSWDLDAKYDTQKRTSTSFRPVAAAQATVAQAAVVGGNVTVTLPQVAPAQPVTPRTMWENLFKNQPSLFPKP